MTVIIVSVCALGFLLGVLVRFLPSTPGTLVACVSGVLVLVSGMIIADMDASEHLYRTYSMCLIGATFCALLGSLLPAARLRRRTKAAPRLSKA